MARIMANYKKTIFHPYLTSVLLGVLTYFIFGAACIPKTMLVADGEFLGEPIKTTVDSRFAALMLTNPKNERVINLFDSCQNMELTTQTLSNLSKTFSPDVATFYFLHRCFLNPINRSNQLYYKQQLNELSESKNLNSLNDLKDYLIAFVPGLGYKEDTTTGADFARQRQLFNRIGVENTLINTDEWGTTLVNAEIIASWIRKNTSTGRKIIIVSASKGGLEVATALGMLLSPNETTNIQAWVSIGGILRGSPIADNYLKAPKCWLAEFLLWTKGKSIELVKDMSYTMRKNEFRNFVFPQGLKIIHFVGAPLATKINREIKSRYCSMKKLGPNDGLTPLTDELTENGIVISELGLDHYFRSPDIDIKTLALALTAINK